jgi:hypothetical protein
MMWRPPPPGRNAAAALTVPWPEASLRGSIITVSTLAGERMATGTAACAVHADQSSSTAAWLLAGLAAVLPFEPRSAALSLGGLTLTPLEALAGLATLGLAWSLAPRLRTLVRRPPLPLLCLAAYAAVQLLSALLAPAHMELALKFAARMVAMAGFAFVVAAAPPAAQRASLAGLSLAGAVVALAAVLEGSGLRALDPWLDHFREMPFNVAGSRRATAFTEYPNLAAGFIMYGLQAAAGLALPVRRGLALALPAALLFALGLLFTYSRGALVATALGLLAVGGLLLARRWARLAALPLGALAVLGAAAAAFAWGGEIFRLRLGSEGTEAFYAVRYQLEDTRLRLAPGERRTTRVQVTNLGQKTWAVDEDFHLSYHWYDQQRVQLEEGGRTRLPRDLAHGESAVLLAEVRAPQQEGQYLLVWDMVHEHTTWFTGQGVAPAVVPTVVSAGGAAAAAPPARAVVPDVAWRPGRWELWRLARDMWRERPLLGVGPDNFRWLHGPRAGQALWDSRVFANNLYLEAAATTGSLGLLALLAALGAALLASARRLLRAATAREAAVPAALFAGLAAIAAHGLVDYLLAFTGHYLVFGLLVGLAAGEAGASR